MRRLLNALVLAGLAAGVLVLRDATLSTHQPMPPDSALAVVVHARRHRAEPTQTLEEMTQAMTLVCRLEVNADPIGPIEPLGNDDFRFVLRPSLDDSDRRQFRGCLEDWRVDGVLLDVDTMVDQ